MSSPLAPYRMLPANLSEELFLETSYAFTSNTGENPGVKAVSDNQYALGSDSDWSADTHDLVVHGAVENIRLLHPLFSEGGLAADDGELLLVMEWTSADSCWRTITKPLLLTAETLSSGHGKAEFTLHLPAGSIRGSGLITLQLLMGNPGSSGELTGLASQRGSRLGSIASPTEIIIDGHGSLFPVQEESLGIDGPLWEMRASWSDPRDEPFSSSYIALILNKDHELFTQLRERSGEPSRQSPLMRQIVSSWIALVIHQVKTDLGHDFDSLLNYNRHKENFSSIADAIAAFIHLGGLDTTSLSTLFVSTQCWFDRRIREAEISI